MPLHVTVGLTTWSLDPTVLLGVGVLAAGYLWLVVGPRLHPHYGSAGSPLCFALGVVILVIALESPLDVAADRYLFSVHMLQHLLLSMVVPPLLLVGLPAAWLANRRISPLIAATTFNATLILWHLPILYEATLHVELIHVTEHLTFLATGALFWLPVVNTRREHVGLSARGKVTYLAVSGVPPMLLGAFFVLWPAVLYAFYAHTPRLIRLSPLQDQQLAGLVMLGLGNLVYLLASCIILDRASRAPIGTRARRLWTSVLAVTRWRAGQA